MHRRRVCENEEVMVRAAWLVLWNERGGTANVLSHGASCPVCAEDFTGVILLKQDKVPTWMESATAFPFIKRVS